MFFLSACYSNRCLALFKPMVCAKRHANGSSPGVLQFGLTYSVMSRLLPPRLLQGKGRPELKNKHKVSFILIPLLSILPFLPRVERQLNCKAVTLGTSFTSDNGAERVLTAQVSLELALYLHPLSMCLGTSLHRHGRVLSAPTAPHRECSPSEDLLFGSVPDSQSCWNTHL